MSQVKDAQGNVLNQPAPQTLNGRNQPRYKDAGCTEIDWFDTHPQDRPKVVPAVEPVPAPAEPVVPAVTPAPTSGLVAGNTTSNLIPATVKSE